MNPDGVDSSSLELQLDLGAGASGNERCRIIVRIIRNGDNEDITSARHSTLD